MKSICGGLLLFFAVCGHAADTMNMSVDRGGSKFVVTLPSNPTTGFQWKVTTYDKKRLTLADSHFIAPQTKLMGAGGQMTFTFARVKGTSYPSSTKMLFTYARPWEAKGGTVKTVVVHFSKKSQK